MSSPMPNLLKQNIENMNIFNERLIEIIEKSEDYLSDFYEESPNYTFNKDFVRKLVWLTYSEKEKKDKLDQDLEKYFN